VPGLRFISLQVGPGADDAGAHGAALAVEPPPAELSDFAETAALIANLDLVIGVDTSTLHLAGALGKPVWVLVPDHMTDWRWLRDRSDSPWYPGVMRLFRQARMGAWAPVVDEVAAALAAW
jgi:ADP-heptose:LPS heptosyltransferase